MTKKVLLLIICFFVGVSYSQTSFTLSSSVCSGTSKTLTANTGTDIALSYTWASNPSTLVFTSVNSATTAVAFPSTGTFTISLNVTLLSGSGTYSAMVNVAASPTISVTQSSPTTCLASNYPKYSQPVYLSPSGGSSNSYTWYPYYSFDIANNAIYVRPSVSMCYTVISTVGSCTGSAVSCVSVIPQFSIALSPASRTICPSYDSLQLNVTAISTLAVLPIINYFWYDPIPPSISNPFNPTVTVSPSVTCTYTVEIYDTRACVSLPAFANVSVASCVGIHSNSIDNNTIVIYPNPVNELLNIDCETLAWFGSATNFKLDIINSLGQVVYQITINNPQSKINIEQLSKGIYTIQIENKTKIIGRRKFVKQ